MKLTTILATGCVFLAAQSQAALISVNGDPSSDSDQAAIVSSGSVGNANDDEAYNTAQQGFDEQQNVLLGSSLSVDGGGTIADNTQVSSHMIFLNSGPNDDGRLLSHYNVTWQFDADILGVMSNRNGSLEVNSSSFLGADDVTYPTSSFSARGLEQNQDPCDTNASNDCYDVFGSQLTVGMKVTEPGDWIRVVTKASEVPEPGTLGLLGLGLLGFGVSRRKQ